MSIKNLKNSIDALPNKNDWKDFGRYLNSSYFHKKINKRAVQIWNIIDMSYPNINELDYELFEKKLKIARRTANNNFNDFNKLLNDFIEVHELLGNKESIYIDFLKLENNQPQNFDEFDKLSKTIEGNLKKIEMYQN